MKYIDWVKGISSLTDTKVIDFPETHEMIERKVVMNKEDKNENKACFEKEEE